MREKFTDTYQSSNTTKARAHKMLKGILITAGIFVNIAQVQSQQMNYYLTTSLRSHAVDSWESSASSTCACRVMCLKAEECTAVTVDKDPDTGVLNCSFATQTILTPVDLKTSATAITWINTGGFSEVLLTSTAGATHTVSTSTSTTETTATTSTTSSSVTETTTATTTSTPITSTTTTSTPTTSATTSTPTTSTTTISTSTTSTTTTSTPTVRPLITIEDLSLENHKKISDGGAMKECWAKDMILYTAYTTQEFDDLRALLIETSFASEDLLVGVQNKEWTDFYGFSRSPESSEWAVADSTKNCAILSFSDDFKLKAAECDTDIKLLCMKLPRGCLPYKQVEVGVTVEVALCIDASWSEADDLCWKNGGRIYTASTPTEMTSMADHWEQNDDNYIDKLWVGERAGKWTVTGRETEDAEWEGSKNTEDKCGSLESDVYLLKEKNCDEIKNVLCKKQVCGSGYEMIPGIGCSKKVGPLPWDQSSQSPCTANGGEIYAPASGDELDMLIEYLNTESTSFNEDMWIESTNTDTSHWFNSVIPTLGGSNCGYLSKDNNFLLGEEDCSQPKAILCRIPRTPDP